MKAGAKTVLLVAAVGTLFGLRYLFLYKPSSEQQFLGGISSLIVGNNVQKASISDERKLRKNSDAPVASIPDQTRLGKNSDVPVALTPEHAKTSDNSDMPMATIPELTNLGKNFNEPMTLIPEQERLSDNSDATPQTSVGKSSYSPIALIPEQARLSDNSNAPAESIQNETKLAKTSKVPMASSISEQATLSDNSDAQEMLIPNQTGSGKNSAAPMASIPEHERLSDNSDAPATSIPQQSMLGKNLSMELIPEQARLTDNSDALMAPIREQTRLGKNSDALSVLIPEQASLSNNSDVPAASSTPEQENLGKSSDVRVPTALIPEPVRLDNNSYVPATLIPQKTRLDDNSIATFISEQGTPQAQELDANKAIMDKAQELEANKAIMDNESNAGLDSNNAALEAMLASAATVDKTVIITTLNKAWVTKGTMLDLFLKSFHKGENTEFLLQHLVIVTLDQGSFKRCRKLHKHCFVLKTKGVDFSSNKGYMTEDYLKMMWRRMSLLLSILEMGYNFVFTDADILWFRNPFDYFSDTDFQIACDTNQGDEWSFQNRPNCGFQYARSNERTIAMYRHWCKGGDDNPNIDEQSLFNHMLESKELMIYKVEIRFLPTERFSGFCQMSNNMSRVVTMHANCCFGLENKVLDLQRALKDWETREYRLLQTKKSKFKLWHVPYAC